MKSSPLAVVLLVLAVAVGILPVSAASAAESKPDVVFQWEYHVLTEEQVSALGKRDLTAGLNKLGDEGWELVTAGARYIFKRPKDLAQKQAAEIQRQVAAAEADVEAWKDRVSWSERMLRKGYLTEKHVEAERTQLKRAEAALDVARRALQNLPPAPNEPEQKEPSSVK
ncbi:MAG TPA: hypothetical protein VKA46_34940 [Gemmataceae bacterium]|nr:hypothetical protein [Gemmataceae bacterium]